MKKISGMKVTLSIVVERILHVVSLTKLLRALHCFLA